MSEKNQFLLLKTRRFAPLFATQFLGSFNDNLFKNALIVLLLFGVANRTSDHAAILTTLAAGIFILPYIVFSALGGDLADKYPKQKVIRTIKIVEIGIVALGALSLIVGSVPLSFLTIFALGCHSAFFGPSKYSILPQHLADNELIGGNALLNTGSFLAILLGTMAGTTLITVPSGPVIVSALLFACAIGGYFASRLIPPTDPIAPDLKINFNVFAETGKILRATAATARGVFLAQLGMGWFYFMGGMFMAQLPNFVHDALRGNEHTLTLLLVLFSVGIAVGGLLNNRLLRGRIEATYVPLAVLGISLFSFDLFFASARPIGHASPHVLIDMAMIAVCGGLFVVPLNAIVQHETPPAHRARAMAASGVITAIFVALSAALSAAMIAAGIDVRHITLIFAVANIFVALYTICILPDYLFKTCLKFIFKILYKVEVRGLENFDRAGNKAVIVANHVSLLDPPLLAAFLPGRPMFAVNKFVAEWVWVKPFLKLVDAFPLDPTNPFSLKALIRKVNDNRQIVIFPEGRLTQTGSLMKIYDGPGMIADKTDAVILPVRLDGVQHTPFARLKGKVPLKSFPKITITILEPRKFKVDENIKGRARRAAASRQLYDLMEDMMFLTGDRDQTLYHALLKAGHVNGADSVIVEDVEFKPMKFKALVRGSIALGKKIAALTQKGENVGLLLPNSAGAVVTFFALQAFGRVPAMLNFSTGANAMLSACTTAQVKTILTSRRFVTLGRLTETVEQLAKTMTVVYLEDLRQGITWADKLAALATSPQRLHHRQRIAADAPAIILFTSGSEGKPKGVVLSHRNLMTNIVQLSSRIDFNNQDIVFNCLPMFHSFGLTGGTLLPILSGIRTFLYPSPLHYRIVPEMVYATNATIMFGTDTFLQGYARMANPYDFFSMRYIFAGAERVKPETRRLYLEKFSTPILEGYGATETAPAICLNSAMHQKHGTVGRFLPGIEYRLEPVPGVTEGGRLYVRGPNVMLGYYKADNPGALQPPEDGWHDTGDIVSIDTEGYVIILGRAKRFAKIAGEMISLAQVENLAQAVWPEFEHAVVTLPDPRKGEQIVLLTTNPEAARDALSAYAAQTGLSALSIPAAIVMTDKIPVLGTGKTDYVSVKNLLEQRAQS